jgi:hypothetical protein
VPRPAALVLGILVMVAVIVALDVLVFRHQFWPRLMVNVGVVLVFAALFLRFRERV